MNELPNSIKKSERLFDKSLKKEEVDFVGWHQLCWGNCGKSYKECLKRENTTPKTNELKLIKLERRNLNKLFQKENIDKIKVPMYTWIVGRNHGY